VQSTAGLSHLLSALAIYTVYILADIAMYSTADVVGWCNNFKKTNKFKINVTEAIIKLL